VEEGDIILLWFPQKKVFSYGDCEAIGREKGFFIKTNKQGILVYLFSEFTVGELWSYCGIR
jgi:hypothetical protein